jgi:hypothetical protein
MPAPSDTRPVVPVALAVEMAEALRLTREYIGPDLLPALAGWSWFDALEGWNAWLDEQPCPRDTDGDGNCSAPCERQPDVHRRHVLMGLAVTAGA